jgi:hypothetical protein
LRTADQRCIFPLNIRVSQQVNVPFLLGYILGAAILVSFAPWGAGGGILLVLAVVSAPVCVTGFSAGRADGQISSAPIVSWWRRAFVLGLVVFSAVPALVVGLWVFEAVSVTGPWRPLATGVWFMLVGGFAGYFYGPMFRVVSRRFPAMRGGERVG